MRMHSVCTCLTLPIVLAACGATEEPGDEEAQVVPIGGRYEVTGEATYAGKPIPAGQIVFESQNGADEPGVMGMAAIKNGQYRSLPEKGPASGPQIVRIAGFEGHENAPPEILEVYPQGKPVFQEYTTKIELPKENTSMDFDVPAQR